MTERLRKVNTGNCPQDGGRHQDKKDKYLQCCTGMVYRDAAGSPQTEQYQQYPAERSEEEESSEKGRFSAGEEPLAQPGQQPGQARTRDDPCQEEGNEGHKRKMEWFGCSFWRIKRYN